MTHKVTEWVQERWPTSLWVAGRAAPGTAPNFAVQAMLQQLHGLPADYDPARNNRQLPGLAGLHVSGEDPAALAQGGEGAGGLPL